MESVAHQIARLLLEDHGDRMRLQRVPQLQRRPRPDVVPHDDDPVKARHRLVMVQELEQDVRAVVRLDDDGEPLLLVLRDAATTTEGAPGGMVPLGPRPAQHSRDIDACVVLLGRGQQSREGCADQEQQQDRPQEVGSPEPREASGGPAAREGLTGRFMLVSSRRVAESLTRCQLK